jgi:hypothetical protein
MTRKPSDKSTGTSAGSEPAPPPEHQGEGRDVDQNVRRREGGSSKTTKSGVSTAGRKRENGA